MGTLRRTCETVPQPSELRYGVVLAVGRDTSVLDESQRSPTGRGRFGVLFSIFTMGNAIGAPTVKCFRFVCEKLTTFPFGKHIVGKLDSCAFWRYIRFQHPSRVYEIFAKQKHLCQHSIPNSKIPARAAISGLAAAAANIP